ncbi:hypothetical protein AB0F91_34950 [Amycolatopsis sp. NPDC023774]|uniref:hypothetical protein n=1 Tax=Amycolatopsis sp. NPDC023774 TaxID=3155015 RepID=UPI003407E815
MTETVGKAVQRIGNERLIAVDASGAVALVRHDDAMDGLLRARRDGVDEQQVVASWDEIVASRSVRRRHASRCCEMSVASAFMPLPCRVY